MQQRLRTTSNLLRYTLTVASSTLCPPLYFSKRLRLFYVTCSRAQESLAVVVYTKEAAKVASYVAGIGWFENEEIAHLEAKHRNS